MSYPYSSLYLESQWAKLRLAQQFCNALGLLCDAIHLERHSSAGLFHG